MPIINSSQLLKFSIFAMVIAYGITSQAVSSDTENKVKAAIIFKITRFIQWPMVTDKILDLCVIGDKALYTNLKKTEGQRSKAYTIKVKEVSSAKQDINGCELLYIGSSLENSTNEINKILKGHAVLSMSDRSRFAVEGGMVQIKERSGRIRFIINLGSVRAAGLDVRSQLLGLAKVIQ